MSPGSFPNQLINQGVNFKINLIIIRIIPTVINVLLIIADFYGIKKPNLTGQD